MMVLDTNVFIDFLRGYPPAVAFFKTLQKRDDVFFSTLTEAELLTCTANKDQQVRERLLHFIHCFQDVAPDHSIAVRAGDLRRTFDLLVPDALIAATALGLRAELVTRNLSDFKKVPELRIRAPY